MTADADAFWTGACIFKDVFYTSSWRTNGPKFFDTTGWTNIADTILDGSSLVEFPVAKHLLTKHERVFAANVLLAEEGELLTDNERSIETDATGWAVDVNCTLARATPPVAAPDGTYSLEVTAVAEGTTSAKLATVEPVTAGRKYRFRAWGLAEAASRSARLFINILDSESNSIDVVGLGSETSMSTSQWIGFDSSYIMPTNAAYVELQLYTNTLLITEQFHWDQIQINLDEQEYRSRVYFSEAGDPTTWETLNWIDVEPDDGTQITGLFSFGEYVVIFKERSIYLLGGVDEQTFTLFPLDTTVGSLSPYSVSGSATHLYWYDHISDHVYRFNGSSIEAIDGKIFGYMDSVIAKKDFVAESAAGVFYRDHYVLSYQVGGTAKGNNNECVVYNENLGAWTRWPNMGFADAQIDNTEPGTRGNLLLLNPASGFASDDDDGLYQMIWSNEIGGTIFYADGSDNIDVSIIGAWLPIEDSLVGQATARVRKVTVLTRATDQSDPNLLNVYLDVNYDRSDRTSQAFEMYTAGSKYGELVGMEADISPLAGPSDISTFSLAFFNSTAADTMELWGVDVSTSERRGRRRGFEVDGTRVDVYASLIPATISLVAITLAGNPDAVLTPAEVSLVPVDVAVESPAALVPATIVLSPLTLIAISGDAYSATYSSTY
jgi:hypothetical protein